jgi:hypothetical protein
MQFLDCEHVKKMNEYIKVKVFIHQSYKSMLESTKFCGEITKIPKYSLREDFDDLNEVKKSLNFSFLIKFEILRWKLGKWLLAP